MPQKTFDSNWLMKCPKCGGGRLTPNDKEHHKWQCMDCNKFFVPKPKKSGRQSIYDRPMTVAERKRRSRQIKKQLEDKDNAKQPSTDYYPVNLR